MIQTTASHPCMESSGSSRMSGAAPIGTRSMVPNTKIQVMTVTGKVVREIMMSELGNIHVGRNITDYAWDGKDQYGDQLANGLYLYRVQSTINDESIEHRATDADKYFKKGWGKMYLMR